MWFVVDFDFGMVDGVWVVWMVLWMVLWIGLVWGGGAVLGKAGTLLETTARVSLALVDVSIPWSFCITHVALKYA